jgi:Thiamine pyrophosphate enzyme, C-terminal TPP binding domain
MKRKRSNRDSASRAEPEVRIHLPPALSPLRTSFSGGERGKVRGEGTYHVEYGYSCMGYEIAGGLGVKLAMPDPEVWVLVGDGSYLMMNSEIATSVMLDKKLNIVVLDNGGFGCIDRLQRNCGGASYNNLFRNGSGVDFARAFLVGDRGVLHVLLEHLLQILMRGQSAADQLAEVRSQQVAPALRAFPGVGA